MTARESIDESSMERFIAPELYDAAYAWAKDDIEFYVAQARAAGGPVLEVGCGTGRVYLPMLRAGADVDGFDLSRGMLEQLRRKAAALGLEPRVRQADMRDFTMPRRYALIVIPFRAFLHNLTTEDQLRTLRACREHLESGGRLVLDLFHPTFERLIEPADAWRLELEFAHPETGAPLALWSRVERDRVTQVMHVEMEFREMGPEDDVIARHPHAFDARWVYKAE
ncbi:MAG TPA: class I SAM-dependent methyltransferase, partial [Terriglobales bacterium]|nr:class I SAM-dependent methyltransferase [Terriglobales bacterium]